MARRSLYLNTRGFQYLEQAFRQGCLWKKTAATSNYTSGVLRQLHPRVFRERELDLLGALE